MPLNMFEGAIILQKRREP